MPEIYFILNQNNVCNNSTGQAELNNLANIFPKAKQFSLNQAFDLHELSNNEVPMLPKGENYVRKNPRACF
jgi:hypothetical protein